jgi:hypothetical protein
MKNALLTVATCVVLISKSSCTELCLAIPIFGVLLHNARCLTSSVIVSLHCYHSRRLSRSSDERIEAACQRIKIHHHCSFDRHHSSRACSCIKTLPSLVVSGIATTVLVSIVQVPKSFRSWHAIFDEYPNQEAVAGVLTSVLRSQGYGPTNEGNFSCGYLGNFNREIPGWGRPWTVYRRPLLVSRQDNRAKMVLQDRRVFKVQVVLTRPSRYVLVLQEKTAAMVWMAVTATMVLQDKTAVTAGHGMNCGGKVQEKTAGWYGRQRR